MSDQIVEISSVVATSGERFEFQYHGRMYQFDTHIDVAKPNTFSFFLLDQAQVNPGDAVLDVGTGLGFLAIVIAGTYDTGPVIATDINPIAVELTRQNAKLNCLRDIDVRQGDLFAPVAGQQFDLILSQPRHTPAPYAIVQEERSQTPHFYLNTSGGVDGLEFIQSLVEGATGLLRNAGRLQIVIPDYLGIQRVLQLMSDCKLQTEVTAKLKTRLSPMTLVRKDYIETHLHHTFPRDEHGKEYMHLVVITGKKDLSGKELG